MEANHVFAETGESIFSTITRLAREHDAVNLGQGFPNFRPPEKLLQRLEETSREKDFRAHQYAPSSGTPQLRTQLSELYRSLYGLEYDPETEITVASGATETIASALYGLINPGDEVVLFDPVYDLYRPVSRRAGADVTVMSLREPSFSLPVDQLERTLSDRTKLVVLTNPHNPTGRVFDPDSLRSLVDLARRHDVVLLADEVYEQLYFDDATTRVPLASLEGARERTLWVGSTGKMFNATGWKIGWACGPPELTGALRGSHQFTTFATATPLQLSVAAFMEDEDMNRYLESYREDYRRLRGILLDGLEKSPFQVIEPQGTYFVIARVPPDLLPDGPAPDRALVEDMIREAGVAAIPLSSFYTETRPANHYLRFAFCKEAESLREGARRLTSVG